MSMVSAFFGTRCTIPALPHTRRTYTQFITLSVHCCIQHDGRHVALVGRFRIRRLRLVISAVKLIRAVEQLRRRELSANKKTSVAETTCTLNHVQFGSRGNSPAPAVCAPALAARGSLARVPGHQCGEFGRGEYTTV